MKIHPCGEWLLVEPIEQSKMGAIWIPDNVDQSYLKARIVEVGDPENEFTKSRGVTVGDNVVYDRVGIVKIVFGGKSFHLLKSREVMARFEEEES